MKFIESHKIQVGINQQLLENLVRLHNEDINASVLVMRIGEIKGNRRNIQEKYQFYENVVKRKIAQVLRP